MRKRVKLKPSSFSLLIYVFLAVLGLHCCTWAFSHVESGGCSLVSMHGFLITLASLVVKHRP